MNNNRQILQNTMFLYLRMLVVLIISLYTSRVVFNQLGISDYGIYNIVGSIIAFFVFINNGLAVASKRFITAEIGKGTQDTKQKVFNICLQSHILIACIVLLLAETIGLWGINFLLDIPKDRIFAGNIVYQFSIFAALIGILLSPFQSVIIAFEKMSVYAYFSILESFLKLVIIFLLQASSKDKLILYSFLLFLVSFCNFFIIVLYCYKNFLLCRFKKIRDNAMLNKIFSFTGWSLLGQATVVGANQGITVLINIFHGVTVNAAMGVCNSVMTIVNGFVGNFQIAFNPQIIKYYVNNEYENLQNLLIRSCKISTFLLIIFFVPIWFEADNLLSLWLGDYPLYSVEFCRWTLVGIFFEAISAPLWMTIYAQTDIKKYQLVISAIYSLSFWGSWILYYFFDFKPYSVIILRSIVIFMMLWIRLQYIKKIFQQFEVWNWLKNVLLRSLLVITISFTFTQYIASFAYSDKLFEFFFVSFFSILFSSILFILIGLNNREKKSMYYFFKNKIATCI